MGFLECDLEDIVYKSHKIDLFDRGLPVFGRRIRQVKIGNYGIADMITIKRPLIYNEAIIEKGIITVYELKKELINISTLMQAINYCRGIQRYIEINYNYEFDDDYIINIVLIGKTIDKNSSFTYISEILTNIQLYNYEYKIDGIYFNQIHGYQLTNEGALQRNKNQFQMKDPAFLFYTSDFLTGVTDLTMEERGQFITMLCLQHQKGHLSEKTIRLSVGLVSVDVRNKFALDKDGNLFNEVLEKHIEDRLKFTESRRNNGLKGGRPKKEEKALGLPSANLPEDVNVNEDINKDDIKKKKQAFDFSFIEIDYKDTFENWIEYKKEKKQEYKTQKSLLAAYQNLKILSEYDPTKAKQIVFNSIANNWAGLFKIKPETKNNTEDGKQYIINRLAGLQQIWQL